MELFNIEVIYFCHNTSKFKEVLVKNCTSYNFNKDFADLEVEQIDCVNGNSNNRHFNSIVKNSYSYGQVQKVIRTIYYVDLNNKKITTRDVVQQNVVSFTRSFKRGGIVCANKKFNSEGKAYSHRNKKKQGNIF